jgi:hypothetical protein
VQALRSEVNITKGRRVRATAADHSHTWLGSQAGDPKPVDAWQDHSGHHFLFALRPAGDGPAVQSFALFKMRWKDNGPVLAVTVTPTADGKHAEVHSIAEGASVQIVPLE